MKYRKKPVVIEAVQFKKDNILEIISFIEQEDIKLTDSVSADKFEDYKRNVIENGIKIKTLEGTMTAQLGDYIIKGIGGEFYPCKPDIFEKTYERVEEEDEYRED
jgi:hypothetical protein